MKKVIHLVFVNHTVHDFVIQHHVANNLKQVLQDSHNIMDSYQ